MRPGTKLVPADCVYVCCACGKLSKTRYGFDDKHQSQATIGWDVSCSMNASLYKRAQLTIENGRVINIQGDPIE